MPNDAVQRLQNIEKEIKAVISIYDSSLHSIFDNDQSEKAKQQHPCQFPENGAPKYAKNPPFVHEFREIPNHSQTPMFHSSKKTGNFVARPSQRNHPGESMLDETHEKLGFSPGFSGSLRINEVFKRRVTEENWEMGKHATNQVSKVIKRQVGEDDSPRNTPSTPWEGLSVEREITTGKVPVTSKSRVNLHHAKDNTNVDCGSRFFVVSDKRTQENKHSVKALPTTENFTGKKMVYLTNYGSEVGKKSDESGEKYIKVPRDQQNVQKPIDNREMESYLRELSKKAEINNEKFEQMKVFKELALEIARHLKSKYEEIQISKQELMAKLSEMEKCNESLRNEAIEVRESRKLLQSKLQELLDTSDKTSDHDMKTEDIRKEFIPLKCKTCGSENESSTDILDTEIHFENAGNPSAVPDTKGELVNHKILTEIQRLVDEKSESRARLKEMKRLLQDRESKIETLERKIRELEEVIQERTLQLQKKADNLNETNRELEMIRKNSGDLKQEVIMLKKNVEEFDGIQQKLLKQTQDYEEQIKLNQDKIDELQNINKKLKEELESEKDGLRIKIKIIDDQQETIKQLKEKSEEMKNLQKLNKSLEWNLNVERQEKKELKEAVERLKWRKDELKKKVKTLENDFMFRPEEVVKDLQKTQAILQELENQVKVKQKEWEVQLQILTEEKDQAYSVAEYATKKLMQKSNEFQKQSVVYKELQRMFAGNF